MCLLKTSSANNDISVNDHAWTVIVFTVLLSCSVVGLIVIVLSWKCMHGFLDYLATMIL